MTSAAPKVDPQPGDEAFIRRSQAQAKLAGDELSIPQLQRRLRL